MFVDREGVLPHNHRIPTGSGKIGAVGKVVILQALHHKDGEERQTIFVLSLKTGRPVHSRLRTLELAQLRETKA